MSKVARTIGKIAGAVSSIARVIPGGQIVAAIAGAVAVTAGVFGALTAKKPIARGNSSQVLIGANLPIPYTMGRAYIGGNLEHDIGYGGTVDGVPNPYAAMTFTYGLGPWQSFESFQADYAPIPLSGNAATGYYGGFLYIDRLLGATPETRALAANWAGEPGWSTAHKMSGHAQAKWSWKFDKKGKVNAGGFPATGVISGMGVQAYDPRQDSTYPGGNPAGTQRLADRSTWGYNANPALHAGSYAQGVYHNGKKVFGVDLGSAAIDWPTIVDWANVCDANGWTINGTIFEPGDKWNNLKLIAQAGSAEPAFTGGVLTFRYDAPRISLDTITIDDLADDELNVPGAANPEERLNGMIPKYRSEANQWEMVQSDLISVPAYVSADGEERQEEYETLLVTGKDQAARLATYRLVNGREIPGIILPCKPRLFEYQIGDALTVGTPTQDIEGLAGQLCVIVGRTPNFERGTVTLELVTETASKHAFALGQIGTAPPPPVLVSAEMRDTISFDASQVDFLTGVIGPEKPDPNATRNDDGANMIRDPVMFERAEFGFGGSELVTLGGGGRPFYNRAAALPAFAGARIFWDDPVPARPSERLFVEQVVGRNEGFATNTNSLVMGLRFMRFDDSIISDIDCEATRILPFAFAGTQVVRVAGFIDTPAETANVRIYTLRASGSDGGIWYASEPSLSRAESGAQVNPADLAALDLAAAAKLGGIQDGADVTADQPVVSRINPTTGNALDTFAAPDGLPYNRVVASGEARDGDVITFSLPSTPKITFGIGGNAAAAGQNVVISDVGTTATGFTMRAVSQAVTPGTTYTDGGATAGSGGEPSRVINRTNGGAPFDGRFVFRYSVTVGTIAPGEPGVIEVGLYIKRSGSWIPVGSGMHGTSGTYSVPVTPGAVDFGAGNEFGISVLYSEGRPADPTSLGSFLDVTYTTGTVVETSLTPVGASPIKWEARL